MIGTDIHEGFTADLPCILRYPSVLTSAVHVLAILTARNGRIAAESVGAGDGVHSRLTTGGTVVHQRATPVNDS